MDNSKVVPLTVDNSKVVPLTVDNVTPFVDEISSPDFPEINDEEV